MSIEDSWALLGRGEYKEKEDTSQESEAHRDELAPPRKKVRLKEQTEID